MKWHRNLNRYISLKLACIILVACSSDAASDTFCQKLEGQASEEAPKTLLFVGNCYRTDQKGEVDYKKAELWFKKAVNTGYPDAKVALAALYIFDLKDEKKFGKAINLIKEAAEQGVAQADFTLGILYLNGLGVEKNEKLSEKHFLKAANQNHGWAMLTLYEKFATGEEKQNWKEKYIEAYGELYSWEKGYSNFADDPHVKRYILEDGKDRKGQS